MLDAYDWENDPGQAALPRVLPKVAKRATPERAFQVALRRWLDLALPLGSVVNAVVNEAAATSTDPDKVARYHIRRKAAGVLPGWPDLQLAWPVGEIAFFEVKAPAGRLSPAQAALHERLRAIGHRVAVVRSIDQAETVLRAWGVPLRVRARRGAAAI